MGNLVGGEVALAIPGWGWGARVGQEPAMTSPAVVFGGAESGRGAGRGGAHTRGHGPAASGG